MFAALHRVSISYLHNYPIHMFPGCFDHTLLYLSVCLIGKHLVIQFSLNKRQIRDQVIRG